MLLEKIMHAWEERLSRKDRNRVTHPFDWGFEFLGLPSQEDAREAIRRTNLAAISSSDQYFAHSALRGFEFDGEKLSFESTVVSPYPENNIVRCRYFPAKNHRRRAVVVLPQWNANEHSHASLCRLLSRIGISALRLTLPYHEQRNPNGGPRADFLVSANIGRTIQGIRQAVVDARNAADWLIERGYESIGILGSSVGSCISFLAFVHDPRFRAGVFNHVSSYFGDVVWKGISTRHVREGIEGTLTREELREAWSLISPNTYVQRLRDLEPRKYLLISARYDRTFPPDLSRLLLEEHHRWGLPYDRALIPCGHYSLALTPFKHVDGFLISKYLRKYL